MPTLKPYVYVPSFLILAFFNISPISIEVFEFLVYYGWYVRDKDYQMYEEILPKIIQWIKDNYDKIPYLDNSNEYYRICITPNNAFELSVWSTSHSDRKYSYKKRIVLSSNDD